MPASSSQDPSALPKHRAEKKQPEMKIDIILQAIASVNWTLADFLYHLFLPKEELVGTHKDKGKATRATRRIHVLTTFLQGDMKYTTAEIVALMYNHRLSRPTSRHTDACNHFSYDTPFTAVHFAKPGLSTWALQLVLDEMRLESNRLISPKAGLRARASRKAPKATPTHDPTITWDIVSKFSLSALAEKYKRLAPVTWNTVSHFMKPLKVRAERIYRPTSIVTTSIISEMVYGRNQHANLFAICRGISLFSMKAHHSIFRVGSRLAQNVPYSTMRRSLVQMAEAKREAWRKEVEAGVIRPFWVVLDNIQAYLRRRDRRIGTDNEMATGCGGTGVEMQDCPEGAFDMAALMAERAKGKREEVTADSILQSIDVDHLERIGAYHWLNALVSYVPALASYQPAVAALFKDNATKHQIDTHRMSKIHPLGTNSANEVTVQGVKEAVEDFVDQIGITPERLSGRLTFVSGDGKTFEGLNKVKKYLDGEPDDFESFRFVEPMLELWHTKWTDLSRICRGHWGRGFESSDPSSLGFLARVVSSPAPSDLKSVDFYTNARLLDLTVKTGMLHCYEMHFETSDLPKYFNEKAAAKQLPTIEALLNVAEKLYKAYSTTDAYQYAKKSLEELATKYPDASFAVGPRWDGAQRQSRSEELSREPGPQSDCDDDDDSQSASSASSSGFGSTVDGGATGDSVLANEILLKRDGIWFMEACRAVACGEIGCYWEVLKVWIFTFSGAGNSKYTTYLTEMYCKIECEFPPATRVAVFNNWLVNLTGKPGCFLEMDLMQEHFNFWLEDLAQHKGKEFSDEWYRDVLSMHVFHFLRLKEEMENTVQLVAVSKTHTAPHLDNEYLAALRVHREHDVHRHREGRDLGHHAQDDFAEGTKALGRRGKLAKYIRDSMRSQKNMEEELPEPRDAADASTYMRAPMLYLNGRLVIPAQNSLDTPANTASTEVDESIV
ncbi:hypothetical protein FA95DRAFT_1502810 [Auriscalpium vulgare]|uniref:Uncharacterized protein n=1 Tax=Auriscalpium vulgare TaxID=40419 RepID=A0ACB8RA53_9AGAM|nr:hypothetical protein FA95DRAFT_1502810 [Auriscalpium vulgare]